MKPRTSLAVVVLLAGAFFAGRATRAQEPAAKEKKARQLVELDGGVEVGRDQFEEMCTRFAADPQIPKEFVKKFREMAKPEDFVEAVAVPVYAKALDDEALDGALAFYATPAGRKLAKARPGLSKAMGEASAKWATEVFKKAADAVEADRKKGK
jgi:hypothetical protein